MVKFPAHGAVSFTSWKGYMLHVEIAVVCCSGLDLSCLWWRITKTNATKLPDEAFTKLRLWVPSAANDHFRMLLHPRAHQFECVDDCDLNNVIEDDLRELFGAAKQPVCRRKLIKNINTTHVPIVAVDGCRLRKQLLLPGSTHLHHSRDLYCVCCDVECIQDCDTPLVKPLHIDSAANTLIAHVTASTVSFKMLWLLQAIWEAMTVGPDGTNEIGVACDEWLRQSMGSVIIVREQSIALANVRLHEAHHEWVHARPAVHSAGCTSWSSSCRLSRSRTGCSSWTPPWPASVWRTLSLHSDLWTVPCVRQCRLADSVASTHDFCCAHDRKWTALFEGDLRDHHQEESTEKMLEWP